MIWALIFWIYEYFERTNLTNIVTTMSVRTPSMHILRPLFPMCSNFDLLEWSNILDFLAQYAP